MSAYSLVCLCIDLINKLKGSRIVNKIISIKIVQRYLNDFSFRGTMNIYQGLIVNLFYTLFRLVIGIYYMLPWFISDRKSVV